MGCACTNVVSLAVAGLDEEACWTPAALREAAPASTVSSDGTQPQWVSPAARAHGSAPTPASLAPTARTARALRPLGRLRRARPKDLREGGERLDVGAPHERGIAMFRKAREEPLLHGHGETAHVHRLELPREPTHHERRERVVLRHELRAVDAVDAVALDVQTRGRDAARSRLDCPQTDLPRDRPPRDTRRCRATHRQRSSPACRPARRSRRTANDTSSPHPTFEARSAMSVRDTA